VIQAGDIGVTGDRGHRRPPLVTGAFALLMVGE
jgi:hypothetical protein